MGRSIVMFQGQHAFVHQYYSDGEWHDVEAWDKLEAQGKPPVIVHAIHDPKRSNKVFLTKDVKASPIYDSTSCLMGYSYSVEKESIPTFEELETVAKKLGYGQTFSRRVLVFVGGTVPLRPALMTGVDMQPFSFSWDGGFWEKRLIEKGFEGVWATKMSVVFDV